MSYTYTIFKKGNWEIHATSDGYYAHIRIDSIIVHTCDAYKEPAHWVIVDKGAINSECSYFEERVPEPIQALWQLQNMDLI